MVVRGCLEVELSGMALLEFKLGRRFDRRRAGGRWNWKLACSMGMYMPLVGPRLQHIFQHPSGKSSCSSRQAASSIRGYAILARHTLCHRDTQQNRRSRCFVSGTGVIAVKKGGYGGCSRSAQMPKLGAATNQSRRMGSYHWQL